MNRVWQCRSKKILGHVSNPQQCTLKANIYKKLMICIWWDYKGVVYHELLPLNQTIDSDAYWCQLDNLNRIFKRNGQNWQTERVSCFIRIMQDLMFLWELLLSHTNLVGMFCFIHHTHQILHHQIHLFRSSQNSLNGKSSRNCDGVNRHVLEFFE